MPAATLGAAEPGLLFTLLRELYIPGITLLPTAKKKASGAEAFLSNYF
jgi:hypothetical protein